MSNRWVHIQSTQRGYYANTHQCGLPLTTAYLCMQQIFLTSRIRVSNWYTKCHHFLGDSPVWSLVDPMEWSLLWKEDYVLDKIGTCGYTLPYLHGTRLSMRPSMGLFHACPLTHCIHHSNGCEKIIHNASNYTWQLFYVNRIHCSYSTILKQLPQKNSRITF